MEFPSSLEIILWLLFFNYCYLNYRLWKLEKSMRKFGERFESLEKLFLSVKENIVLIVDKLRHLEVLKNSSFHVKGQTPLGNVDVDIELGKKPPVAESPQ